MSDYPDHETFARHVGESFSLQLGEGERTVVELVEAAALPAHGRAGRPELRQQPFSLLFVAAGLEMVPQRTYRLEHEQLGAMDVFLVPVGRNEKGVMLEAVFA